MKKSLYIICTCLALFSFLLCGCQPSEKNKNNIVKKEQIVSTMVKPNSGNPGDYSPYENLLITAGVFYDYTAFIGNMEGRVDAKVLFIPYAQTIRNYRKKVGNEVFSQAVSYSSMKKVAEQRLISDPILLRKGSNISDNMDADWNGEVKQISEQDYLNAYGVLPLELVKYVINRDTVLEEKSVEVKDGIYVFEYVLDAEAATKCYRNEVQTLAGADKAPKFETVSFTITIDANWNIQKVSTREKYAITIPLIGSANCSVKMTETFTHLDDANLALNEKDELLTSFKK